LIKRVDSGVVVETRLVAGEDSLTIDRDGGETLDTMHESWTCKGDVIYGQVMDQAWDVDSMRVVQIPVTDDDVKRHLRQTLEIHGTVEQWQAQIRADYAQRRTAFLASYKHSLASAGISWHALGLDAVD
jgi:hypothetical protein